MLKLLCVLLVLSVVCTYAKQTTVDASNITAALKAAADGDEFILLSGTYQNWGYVMYGMSLSFASASGNSADVIVDGQGNNEVGPLMIYYDEDNTTLPQNLSVSLTVSGITFVNGGSFVGGPPRFVGGTIYINSSAIANVTVNITNCVFKGGYADFGGVIFSESLGSVAAQGPVNISISNSVFTGNRALQGIIYVDEANLVVSNCTFDDSTIDNAGGIFLTASTLTFTNSNFSNSVGGNVNGGFGGAALFVDSTSSASISRSYFEHNNGQRAGTIYSLGTLSIATTTFLDNQVLIGTNLGSLGGGALTVRGGQLTVVNSTFEENGAQDDGGAIFTVQTPTTITGCVFDQNHADHGGAIIFHDSTATLRACYFSLNTALFGGAIFAVNNAEVVVDDSTISQNGAIGGGGGIYTLNSSVTFSDGLMANNNGQRNGGAVFVDESGSIHLVSASVTENSASQGPSIYCTGGAIYILNSTVSSSASRTTEKNGVYCNSATQSTNCDIVADNSPGDWNNVCIDRGTGGNNNNNNKKNGFPAWAIALIVVLSVAAIVSVAGLVYYISKRKKKPTSFGRM